MFRKTLSIITLGAIVATNAVPAQAVDVLNSQRNTFTAGFYLRIPFGPVKKMRTN